MNSISNAETPLSMLTSDELLDWLDAAGITIEVVNPLDADPALRLTPPPGCAISADIEDAVARHKPALLAILREDQAATRGPVPIRSGMSSERDGERQVSLPPIDAGNLNLADVARQAWDALRAANESPDHFRHGNALVRLDADDMGQPVMTSLTPDRLRHKVARSAWWFKVTRDGIEDALPPRHVVLDMLADPSPVLPRLVRIVETPVFTATGDLVIQPGFHAPSGIYYAPAPSLIGPPVPTVPAAAEIAHARDLLLELICDFPFTADAERANALAVLFEQPARELIDGPMPLHCIEAPDIGVGKGLLADMLLLPFIGDRVGKFAECRTDDEWRKRISTVLREMAAALLLDNVRHPLDSGVLAAALTAIYWDDRLLGTNDLLHLPVRCSWLMTGNNPVFSREISRRVVRTRLDAKIDRAWEREGFRHPNLLAWGKEHRGELVEAVLTLVQAWIVAGKPEGKISLGSYERWAAVIGGILDTAGIPGFLGNLEAQYEAADAEGEAWRRLVELWWETHAGAAVGVAELFALAARLETFDFGKGDERAQKISFGKQLGNQRDRVIGGYCITFAGAVKRINQWQLVPTPPPAPAAPAPES